MFNFPSFYDDTSHTYISYTANDAETQRVIAVMEEWFWAIEDGSANLRMPDLTKPLPDRVDEIIKVIDDRINYEIEFSSYYFRDVGMETKEKPIDIGADFCRLQGLSRDAFVQDVLDALEDK